MNDLQTISAIASADGAVMNHIIDQYSKLMWSIAGTILTSVGTTQDIEECVADTFIYLWEHPKKFNAKRGKLKTFLCIVARSKATDRYRKLSRQSTASLDDDVLMSTLDITNDVLSDDTKRSLISAIQLLEEPSKEIILRRYYYEQKPKEIAFALDMPVKQVENQLYRTKLKLRQLLTN